MVGLARRYAEIMLDVENLINDHSQEPRFYEHRQD